MRVAEEVLAVLDRCRTENHCLFLPPGQLDRTLYVRVNAVLTAAGGKWVRGLKAHEFPGDAAEAIDQVLISGEVRTHQEVGDFPTPPAVVAHLLHLADVAPGMWALEPSAGEGAIAGPLAAAGALVGAIEQDPAKVRRLADAAVQWAEVGDFLEADPAVHRAFDRVVMNPPFARQADLRHVMHAWHFVAPGGRLVSVMAAGVTFRQTGLARRFRELVAEMGGTIEALPDGAFRESGTMVRTVVVTMDRPA